MKNVKYLYTLFDTRDSFKSFVENLFYKIFSFIDSKSESLIVVIPGAVRGIEDGVLHLKQTLEALVINLLNVLQSSAERRLAISDIWNRGLLSIKPPNNWMEVGLIFLYIFF